MESTTALKSGLAIVSALEGVVIAVNLFSLMGFLFSIFSFNDDSLILRDFLNSSANLFEIFFITLGKY